MAGLTREGFTPLSYEEVIGRISNKLNVFSPGIDLPAESPDGQLLHIFSFEIAQVWAELGLVHSSYNPYVAAGAGLRNLGQLTGIAFGAATRSQATVQLIGTAGTTVPRNSLVLDADGNEFATSFDAVIPASVLAVAKLSGPIAVPAGTLVNIGTAVNGWDSVTQDSIGQVGAAAQTDVQFRNLRNKTVLRNFVEVAEVMRGRLLEDLGIQQVVVVNNDHDEDTAPDGTPPQTIHVTVGEIDSFVTDEDIAQIILETKGLGCPTYGAIQVPINDQQGNPHTISFSKAEAKSIFIRANITFLDDDYAGAQESIENSLIAHINSLATSEDVIWSRLFEYITPFAKAQVNMLEISFDGINYGIANLAISTDEFANTELGLLDIQVTN